MTKKNILEVIVELTGETPVQYSGELKAIRCPFHDDKKPSLVIYESTASYFCYPCSMGGDVYNFYSRFNECSYRQAKEAIDGNSNLLEEITQTLDGIHVKDQVDYNSQTNIAISKYCRNLMFSYPEKVDKVMEFLKQLDMVLQKPITSAIMKEQIEKSRELDK